MEQQRTGIQLLLRCETLVPKIVMLLDFAFVSATRASISTVSTLAACQGRLNILLGIT